MFIASHKYEHFKYLIIQGGPLDLHYVLFTAALEGTAVLYWMKSLARTFYSHESTVAQVLFLRRAFQPSTYQLRGICFDDIAQRSPLPSP